MQSLVPTMRVEKLRCVLLHCVVTGGTPFVVLFGESVSYDDSISASEAVGRGSMRKTMILSTNMANC